MSEDNQVGDRLKTLNELHKVGCKKKYNQGMGMGETYLKTCGTIVEDNNEIGLCDECRIRKEAIKRQRREAIRQVKQIDEWLFELDDISPLDVQDFLKVIPKDWLGYCDDSRTARVFLVAIRGYIIWDNNLNRGDY